MASAALPCLEAMYRDLARMLGDQETEDMALVCQGQRLMVHSFLLCARSGNMVRLFVKCPSSSGHQCSGACSLWTWKRSAAGRFTWRMPRWRW